MPGSRRAIRAIPTGTSSVDTATAAEWRKGYAKVMAKAWSAAAYKDKLLREPRSVLAEAGLKMPLSVEITVVEDAADKRHLVLPRKPAEGEIDEEVLAGVVVGAVVRESR